MTKKLKKQLSLRLELADYKLIKDIATKREITLSEVFENLIIRGREHLEYELKTGFALSMPSKYLGCMSIAEIHKNLASHAGYMELLKIAKRQTCGEDIDEIFNLAYLAHDRPCTVEVIELVVSLMRNNFQEEGFEQSSDDAELIQWGKKILKKYNSLPSDDCRREASAY